MGNNAEELISEASTSQVKSLIDQCLSHASYQDALFIAEIFHEKANSDSSLILLADGLLRLARYEELYALLFPKPRSSARLRYAFAKCCYELQRLDECERSLTSCDSGERVQLHPCFANTPSEGFAHALLASVLCETGRVEMSKSEYGRSLETNMFVWSSIARYVAVGGTDINSIIEAVQKKLRISDENTDVEKKECEPEVIPTKPSVKSGVSLKTPTINSVAPKISLDAPRKSTRLKDAEPRRSSRLYSQQDAENACTRNTRTIGVPKISRCQSGMKFGRTNEMVASSAMDRTQMRTGRVKQPLTSRNANSVRSLCSSETSVASVTTGLPKDIVEAVELAEKSVEPECAVDPATRYIFLMMKELSVVEQNIGKCNWKDAIRKLDGIAKKGVEHAVSQTMRARVMFEMGEYSTSRELLEHLRKERPHRVEGMELLSTAMWHQQASHSLSALSIAMTSSHRCAPQTWCVTGNCFSLQRQHAQAVQCMERALQLDPSFAYAHTLLGHELIMLEELDKAETAFRNALKISPNDYRAWYGLGLVQMRNEHYGLASANMWMAVKINGSNKALLCQLSQIEHNLGRKERAMQLIDRALEFSPNDVACRYNRARMLYELGRYPECLDELKKLKELSPDEAHIFHLLGKVYRRLGSTHRALLNYSWATEMDPRGEQMLATAGEHMDDDAYSPPASSTRS